MTKSQQSIRSLAIFGWTAPKSTDCSGGSASIHIHRVPAELRGTVSIAQPLKTAVEVMRRCPACGLEYAFEDRAWRCRCGGALQLSIPTDLVTVPSASGLWRFAGNPVRFRPGEKVVSLGEGATPGGADRDWAWAYVCQTGIPGPNGIVQGSWGGHVGNAACSHRRARRSSMIQQATPGCRWPPTRPPPGSTAPFTRRRTHLARL